ncbi:hypothetical protein [Pseudolactococcus carnosus]|uniref:Uncharacterized protein n=1 Tax=Pseudolactococcus carnosus TaxID=2749961 RepID=A0ABT0AQR3_9LACT|nr:hypothetical protein [Lactococcus carnosus]MCJ1989042.1 hypothetical protein [Lactococcus carnosus]
MTTEKEYYSVTNKIFELADADEWDYTTLAAIASFNLPFVSDKEIKATTIETSYITLDMIMQKLVIIDDTNNRNKARIKKSLKKLGDAGVISIVATKKANKNSYFKLSQNIAQDGQNQGFHSIVVSEFENICFNIEKVTDKTKALACYMFVCHRVFRASKQTKQANFNWVNQLQNYICWDAQENIGKAYNKKRESVSKTIQQLVDAKAIATRTIRRKSETKEVKNIYSKFSDSENLDDYIKLQIENGEYAKEVVKKVKSTKTKAVKAKVTAKKEVSEIKQDEKEQTKAQIQSLKFAGVENGDDIKGFKKQAKIFDDTAFKSAIEKARTKAETEKQKKLLDLADFKASENTTTSINYDKLFPF